MIMNTSLTPIENEFSNSVFKIIPGVFEKVMRLIKSRFTREYTNHQDEENVHALYYEKEFTFKYIVGKQSEITQKLKNEENIIFEEIIEAIDPEYMNKIPIVISLLNLDSSIYVAPDTFVLDENHIVMIKHVKQLLYTVHTAYYFAN
jgi:hypothetical protein